MKKEKIYFRFVVAIIITLVLWLEITPDAFNIDPILGFLALFSAPVLDYWLIKPVFKYKNSNLKTN